MGFYKPDHVRWHPLPPDPQPQHQPARPPAAPGIHSMSRSARRYLAESPQRQQERLLETQRLMNQGKTQS